MPAWRKVPWTRIRRRLTAAGTLLAFIAATVGVPLPPPPVVKDGGKAFPCQGRACGCQTAEECWRHCCCTTPEERWAWAAEHNVTPPAYAERPADDGWRTTPLRERGGEKGGCCACCKGKQPPGRWGSTASALACRGLSTQWVTTGAVPATPPAASRRPEAAAVERIVVGGAAPRRVFRAPPLPPPRLPLSSACI